MSSRFGRRVRRVLPLIGAFAFTVTTFVVVTGSSTSQAAQPAGLDHFVCYDGRAASGSFNRTPPAVLYQNQFTPQGDLAAVRLLRHHCNPVQKTRPNGQVTPITNPAAHLVCWDIVPNKKTPAGRFQVENQFGTVVVDVGIARTLCLPSWKNDTVPDFPNEEQPPGLGHFVCYDATRLTGDRYETMPPSVRLLDQWGDAAGRPRDIKRLCVPSAKTLQPGQPPTPIVNADAHLACFTIAMDTTVSLPKTVFDKNQFGIGTVTASATRFLCLPSFKKPVTTGPS